MKGILIVDPERCVGCRNCELACAVEHSQSRTLAGAIKEDPPPRRCVWVESGEHSAMPIQCRQCENAPCVAICPTRALARSDRDRPVELTAERCIGCNSCVLACPFGVIQIATDTATVLKCDQCRHRVDAGQLPACVSSCITGALQYRETDERPAAKRRAYLVEIERTQRMETVS